MAEQNLEKKLTELSLCVSLSFRSAQSEFEATFTFTDTAKVKLFTAENESSSKTAVSLDTPLVVIVGFGDRHLEYFIQDVDEDVFDRVSDHVRVSTHPVKLFLTTSVIAKSLQYFLLMDVCLL